MIATTKDCYHRLYLFYGQRDLLLPTTHSFSKKLKSAIKSKAISVQFQPKVQFNFNLASDSDSISASSYLPNYPTQLPPYQPTILPIYGPTNQPTNLPTRQRSSYLATTRFETKYKQSLSLPTCLSVSTPRYLLQNSKVQCLKYLKL